MTHEALRAAGSNLGCGSVSVVEDGACIVERALSIAEFFKAAQCGQCPPCRMEIPHFVDLNRKYRDQGLAIVGLNSEQTRDKAKAARLVRDFCKNEGVDYPCAVASDKILDQVPDLEGFPTTLFFDRGGHLRLSVVGYHDSAFLEAVVEALLHERPAVSSGDSTGV
jgi:thiol-disulfide isomerase/thioredoxin